MINLFKPSVLRTLIAIWGLTAASLTGLAQTEEIEVDFTDTIRLKKNKRFKGYAAFDTSIKDKKIFIAGENHTYLESNTRLWVQNIKYLHKHAGVRHVIMEHGRSSSWLVNQYITTGDSMYYNVIKKYMFEEFATAYNKLMKFNKKLDSNERVQVVGLDLERGGFGAVKVLSMLIPRDDIAHDSIDLHIESILGMAMYQDKEIFNKNRQEEEDQTELIKERLFGYDYSLTATIKPIISNFIVHEDHYKSYLGENFELFKDIILGLKETLKWREFDSDKAIQDYVFREKYMYNRFVVEYGSREGGFYGQFGRCHSSKRKVDGNSCEWYVFKSLAHRIKNSRKFDLDSSVVTMGIMYKREDLYKKEDWHEAHDIIEELFDSLDDQRVLLYNLKSDTVLQNYLEEDFDYLFLNSNYPDKDHPYYREEIDLSDFETDVVLKVLYAHGSYDLDLTSLGSIHAIENQSSFSEPLMVYGLVVGTSNEDMSGISSMTYFGVSRGIENMESDSLGSSLSTKLNGYFYKSVVTYDLLSSLKFIDIELGGFLGYSQLTFRVTETQNKGSLPVSSGFLGDRSESVYRNPAITAGFVGGIDINIGPITVGYSVMSIYDLSKKDWRLSGDLVQDGPETSFNGFLSSARVGFNFEF